MKPKKQIIPIENFLKYPAPKCEWKPEREVKEAQPKKIDVVEAMDKIERRESLEEGKKGAKINE